MVPVLLCLVSRQAAPATDPDSAELEALVKADQADRQFFIRGEKPTKEQLEGLSRRDTMRYYETKQILFRARTLTPDGFDSAALLMQHGETIGSFEIAHELSVCACLLGKIGSMPALAEDRFLRHVGRLQRFGSRFSLLDGKPTLDPVDEKPPTAVTDYLRGIYFVPTLKRYMEAGGPLQANQAAMPTILKAMEHRVDSKWVTAHSDPRIASDLLSLKPNEFGRVRVLKLYDANRLVSDSDFCRAAEILDSSNRTAELPLAHELAAAAVKERFRKAIPAFMKSWDRFLLSIGLKPRYSASEEPPSVKALFAQEK